MWLTIIGVGIYVLTIGGLNFGQVHASEVEDDTAENQETTMEHQAATDDQETSYVEESLEILIAAEKLNAQPTSTLFTTTGNNNEEFYTALLWYMQQKDDAKDFYYLEQTLKFLANLPESEASKYGLDREELLVALAKVYENPSTDLSTSNANLYTVTELNNGLVLLEINKPGSIIRASFYVNGDFYSACERVQCDRYVVDAKNGDTITLYYTSGIGKGLKTDIRL